MPYVLQFWGNRLVQVWHHFVGITSLVPMGLISHGLLDYHKKQTLWSTKLWYLLFFCLFLVVNTL